MGAATLGAGPVFAGGRPLDPLAPGIKISLQIPGDFTAEDLIFAKQLGVEYVSIPTRGGTYETFARHKQRVEAAGLKVANIGNANVHNMPEVTLKLPGRDQKIEEYKQYLRNLASAGIFYTTFGKSISATSASHRRPCAADDRGPPHGMGLQHRLHQGAV
jgi:mannonate dehydratase